MSLRTRTVSISALVFTWLYLVHEVAAAELVAVINKNVGDQEIWGVLTSPMDLHGPVIAKVKAGERFIAVAFPTDELWPVYLQSGVRGWMPREKIRPLSNARLPKLAFRREDVLQWATGEPAEAVHQNVDYGRIVEQAITGDPKALTEFFDSGRFMDGAAAEAHDEVTWGVFHLVGDEKFSRFVRDASTRTQKIVKDYLTNPGVSYPISKPIPYVRRYFPKTYRLIFRKPQQ